MAQRDLSDQIALLATLDEPVRKQLYLYVASRDEPVSRDAAAQAVGVPRALAAFHLDRLAEGGLLDVSFKRLTKKSGPGAGRPSKLYRRSAVEVAVSLPSRSYDLAAQLLAAAIDTSDDPAARKALSRIARKVGERIGGEARERRPASRRKASAATRTIETLSGCGYEPTKSGTEIQLRNCPFHALVDEHRELVCGMNLALVEGVVAASEVEGVTPVLRPTPGLCCVALKLGA